MSECSAPSSRVSLCMIAKNEQKSLRECLLPVAPLFHEIIVVDTGSTDATKSIARELGAQVHDFPWIDDFSAARNESLRHASGDWIFWLDADDRISPSNVLRLSSLFESLGTDLLAYMIDCRCPSSGAFQETMIYPHPRLFRRHPNVRWQYRVHEQLTPAFAEVGYRCVSTNIAIDHIGYAEEALVRRKINRDLRLLRLDYLTYPDDPSVLLHLAQTHARIGEHQYALNYLLPLYQGEFPLDDWGRMLFNMLAETLNRLGRGDEAARVNDDGLRHFPYDLSLLHRRGVRQLLSGHLGEAEATLKAVIAADDSRPTVTRHLDSAITKREARRSLGFLYTTLGDFEAAETTLLELVAEHPDFLEGQVTLASLYLGWNLVERAGEIARRIGKTPMGRTLAKTIDADILLKQDRCDEALPLLHSAIGDAPKLLWPHWVLSRVHLRLGDFERSRRALDEILRLNPGDPEATEELAKLERVRDERAELAKAMSGSGEFVVSFHSQG